jgi:hypothetical protein
VKAGSETDLPVLRPRQPLRPTHQLDAGAPRVADVYALVGHRVARGLPEKRRAECNQAGRLGEGVLAVDREVLSDRVERSQGEVRHIPEPPELDDGAAVGGGEGDALAVRTEAPEEVEAEVRDPPFRRRDRVADAHAHVFDDHRCLASPRGDQGASHGARRALRRRTPESCRHAYAGGRISGLGDARPSRPRFVTGRSSGVGKPSGVCTYHAAKRPSSPRRPGPTLASRSGTAPGPYGRLRRRGCSDRIPACARMTSWSWAQGKMECWLPCRLINDAVKGGWWRHALTTRSSYCRLSGFTRAVCWCIMRATIPNARRTARGEHRPRQPRHAAR